MIRPSLFYVIASILMLTTLSSCTRTQTVHNDQEARKRYPEFSWDHIPKHMHVWKKADYTDAELDYLAGFPLITFEKAQGTKTGSVQDGTLRAARAVKERNPNAQILYYKNIVIDWTGSAASAELAAIEGGYLQGADGSYPVVNQNSKCKFFDISQPAVQDWWMQDATQMLNDPSINGIFIDANIKVLDHGYFSRGKKLGAEKATQLIAGYDQLLTRLNDERRQDSIILANIIRARFEDGGLSYLKYFDGSYLEAFEHNVGGVSKPDYLAKGIASAQQAARAGSILAFSIGLGDAMATDSSGIGLDEARHSIKSLKVVQKRLDYITAIFLVIAEPYSYFLPFGSTYGVDGAHNNRTWMHTFPIFEKKLGPPKGPATRDGYIYTREFEHCSVWLDIEHETARLDWQPTGEPL